MSGNTRKKSRKKGRNTSGKNNHRATDNMTNQNEVAKVANEENEEKEVQEVIEPAQVKADSTQTPETDKKETVSKSDSEHVKKDIKGTGKFGLGHTKTKKAAIFYIFEDIGEGIIKAKNWCVTNYRKSIPAAIVLVLVVIVIVSLVRNARISRQEEQAASEQAVVTEAGIVIPDEPLQENAYDYVNQFVARYYEACATGDVENYMMMRSYTDETEQVRMQKKADYIDHYQNISCYTKPGPVENSYLVYVYYEVKFTDVETAAPGLNTLYVCTNDAGELYVFSGDADEYVSEYMQLVSTQQDVKDLFNKVQVTYNDAVDSDETLKAFLEELAVNLKNDVGEGIASIEANNPSTDVADASGEQESTDNTVSPEDMDADADDGQSDDSQEGEETAGDAQEENQEPVVPVTETVRATDLVNVRSSASVEASKLGAVREGTRLTRLEEMANGWSRVEFDGGEGYIKSEYLEVVESAAGTVTALENVNIRAEASETATKLGMAYKGTALELIEAQEDGWSRIIFNGQTAYVKSEFVQ